MPKNFQTSQYDEPIAFEGYMDVEVDGETYRVGIERAHMEEDTGKSLHVGGSTGRIHGADYSLVDYNRAGIPLIEIVTKPVLGTGDKAPEVARAYVGQLRELLLGLGVSDVRMEQGSLRCDVNLSLAPKRRGGAGHPHRDQERELAALGRAGRALRDASGTARSWPAAARSCRRRGTGTRTPASPRAGGRSPTPRTTATSPSPTWCRWRRAGSGSTELRGTLPEPPHEKRARLQEAWGFSDLDMRDTVGAGALGAGRGDRSPRARRRRPRASGGSASSPGAPTSPRPTSRRSASRRPTWRGCRRSSTTAPSTTSWRGRCFDGLVAGEGTPDEIVAARGLGIVSDEGALAAAVDSAIAANPDVADKIRDGKVAAAGALIGAVMKEMRGQADAGRVRELILEKLVGLSIAGPAIPHRGTVQTGRVGA